MTVITNRNEVSNEVGLAAIAATSSLDEAKALCEAQGYVCSAGELHHMRRTQPQRILELRERITPRLEQELANGLLDNARLAQIAIGTAIKSTQERLDNGVVADPSKTARDLADVVAKSIDKKLALEGRPQKIVETRDITSLVGRLERLGVIEGTAEDE